MFLEALVPKQTRSRRTSVPAAASSARSSTFLAKTIELVSTDSLSAYARELRKHSDKQITQIAASLRVFGFLVPVIAAADNTIVAGHRRWLAAKYLGLPSLPVIRVDHLSPERLRAFRLADNRLAENAGWNHEALALELSELTGLELDFELELTGLRDRRDRPHPRSARHQGNRRSCRCRSAARGRPCRHAARRPVATGAAPIALRLRSGG